MDLNRRLDAIEDWLEAYPCNAVLTDQAIREMGQEMNLDGPTFLEAFLRLNPCRMLNKGDMWSLCHVVKLTQQMQDEDRTADEAS